MSPSIPPYSSAYPPGSAGNSVPPFPQMMHQGGRVSTPQRQNSLVERPEDELSVDEDDDNGVNATGEAPRSGKKEAKRRRQVQSCSECRRRKIKCDKTFPCGPCVLRQDQARCREVEKHAPSTSACATLTDLEALRAKLAHLESVLVRNGTLAASDFNASPIKPQPRALNSIKSEPLDDGDSDTEGAAMTLEHLAFGRGRADSSQTIPLDQSHLHSAKPSAFANGTFPAVYPRRLENDAAGTAFYTPSNKPSVNGSLGSSGDGGPNRMDAVQGNAKKVLEALEPTEIFSMFYQRSDVFVRALLSVMPSSDKGEILVRTYLERVEWLHRCLHVPTFLRQCQQLWAVPVEELVQRISTPFLSLYLIVCCLGLHFMDSAEASLHFKPHEIETLPDVWFTAARGGMWGGDFLADHTIVGLQSLILCGVFLNNRDRADAAWALLGAGIKMAQGMGLSRLGGEGVQSAKWTGQWASLTQREVGRRLWWNLVFLDWNIAPSYHYCSSIQPNQIKTALPANVEDEDLNDNQPLVPRPLTERTGMSYHLARLRFAEISQRQIYQANSSPHPPYSFILSVDSELRKAIADLPPFFQPQPHASPEDSKTRVHYYENIIINLSGHTRLLRLHRPWLSRGYKDQRFQYSKEQCVRAARASLQLMRDNDGAAVFLERWWIPLFYVTVSGSVVLIDLLRQSDKALHSAESQAKIDEVLGAVRQMKRIGSVSFPARDSIRVLETLLAEVEERRNPETTLGKRKADGDGNESGLKRAVKKLILDAAQSPNGVVTTPGSMMSDSSQPASTSRGTQDQKPLQGPPASDQFNFNAANVGFDPNNFASSLPSMYPYQGLNAGSHSGQGEVFPFTAPPPLDPAVTSMLSNYFPQPDTTGMQGQAPDDFLQRLLSFSWDGTSGQQAPQGQVNTQTQASQGEFAPSEGWGSNGWMG